MPDDLLRGDGTHVLVNGRSIVAYDARAGAVASALLWCGRGTDTIAITVQGATA